MIQANPFWPVRVAAAHTVPRECREEEGWTFEPGQFDAVRAPTVLSTGSDSVAEIVRATRAAAGAISGAQMRVLDGHGHFTHKTDPSLVASVIREFTSRSYLATAW
ncbi:MAG TPA: hypothetical protein VJM33_17330 [Microthrixaceae bacterium]|nr:hypothetical protein [Microthrixaceae bacterium]